MDKNKSNTSEPSTTEDGRPEAKYTRIGEKIRQAIPGPMQCSMACGGRNCKWENPARWSDSDQAIKGVFSSWVLDNVVAMSRPSTEVIEKYDMIQQFKKHKISSIINLQRPGEHASCGPPLDKDSLFTYQPKTFMDNDIFFYNFGWKDFGVTSLNTILDMVKVMCFALEDGSVAVHCHAGLGRTGVLIACYLVFAHRMEPGAAILKVREKRSNSIQTRGQIACVHEFWQFLRPLRIVFPQVVPHSKRLSLKQFLMRQYHLLHGFESRELRYTPKLVHVVCSRLAEMVEQSDNPILGILQDKHESSEKPVTRCNTVADIKEAVPGAFVNEEKENDMVDKSSSPTNVDAVLSPRITRRGTRSRNTSECSNRPLSAGESHNQIKVDETNNLTYAYSVESLTDLNTKHDSASNTTDQITLQSPVTPHNSMVEQVNGNSEPNLQTTFVQAQNVTSLTQSHAGTDASDSDIHSDDDGGIRSRAKAHDDKNSMQLNNSQAFAAAAVESENSNENNNSEIGAQLESEAIPSPQLSPHEPKQSDGVRSLVSSHTAGIQATILAETQPPNAKLRRVRLSAGRSDAILPTGSRSQSSRGTKSAGAGSAAKSDRDEQNSSEGASEEPASADSDTEQVSATNETPQLAKDAKAILTELTDSEGKVYALNEDDGLLSEEFAGNTESETREVIDKPSDSVPEPNTATDENADVEAGGGFYPTGAECENAQGADDLEVIDIGENVGPSLSDSDNEELNASMASKISWTQKINEGKTEGETEGSLHREASASSRNSGRRTPLMYRAGHTLELLDEREKQPSDASDPDQSESCSDGRETPSPANSLGDQFAEENSNPAATDSPNSPVLHPARPSKSMNDLASALQPPSPSPSRRSSAGDIPRVTSAERRSHDKLSIARAFSYKLTDDEYLWEKIFTRQRAINSQNDAWDDLSRSSDPYVLCSLMWTWLEHLESPVISDSDVLQILKITDQGQDDASSVAKRFDLAIGTLDKAQRCTVRRILDCVHCFNPLPSDCHASVIRRIVTALMHRYPASDETNDDTPETSSYFKLVKAMQGFVQAKYLLSRNGGKSGAESPQKPAAASTSEEVILAAAVSPSSKSREDDPPILDVESSAQDPLPGRSEESIHSSSSSGSSNSIARMQPSIVVS